MRFPIEPKMNSVRCP